MASAGYSYGQCLCLVAHNTIRPITEAGQYHGHRATVMVSGSKLSVVIMDMVAIVMVHVPVSWSHVANWPITVVSSFSDQLFPHKMSFIHV